MSNGLVLFTFFHVLLAVAGIASGAIVAGGFLLGRRLEFLTTFFLATTLATSLTGFLFPVEHLMPSHLVGAGSVGVLAVAYFTRGSTSRRLRRVFVGSVLAALYLNVFVLIAQAFMKIPPLRELAPSQTEPPFAVTQGILLLAFMGMTVASLWRIGRRAPAPRRPESADAPSADSAIR